MAYTGNTAQNYNTGGTSGSVGPQLIEFHYAKKALIEQVKDRVFGQLTSSKVQPKHKGKKMMMYHYLPILDERNINDQGIDATGASTANVVTIAVVDPNGNSKSIAGYGTDASTALVAAQKRTAEWCREFFGPEVGDAYADIKTALGTNGWTVVEGKALPGGGNFYGSSKDIGTMTGKMPALSEEGGRVNRVGNTRRTIESNLKKFGFFEEWTDDFLTFDTDPELYTHISREATRAANELVEDMIQIDLINNAGVVMHGGTALSVGQLDDTCTLTYGLLDKTKQVLNENRCPTSTTIITGSTNVDTKTVGTTRYVYVGSEMSATLQTMTDPFGDKAFVPIEKYASATNTANGEIGAIGAFRFIEAMEMTHWAGVGATATGNGLDTHYVTDGKYDVFPCLVVGSGAFYTVSLGAQSQSNFRIIVKKPGYATADRNDPYGQIGFWSTLWWYGFMVLRPEWIACLKVTAPVSI